MLLSLDIRDKLYEKINSYCSINDVAVNECIIKWIEDGLYTEMYGDLNKLLGKEEKTEKKKQKKVVQVTDIEPKEEKTENNCQETVTNEKSPSEKTVVEEVTDKPKRKTTRRTLKSK